MCLRSCFMLTASSSVFVRFPLCANAIPNGAFVYRGCASAEQPLPPISQEVFKNASYRRDIQSLERSFVHNP